MSKIRFEFELIQAILKANFFQENNVNLRDCLQFFTKTFADRLRFDVKVVCQWEWVLTCDMETHFLR